MSLSHFCRGGGRDVDRRGDLWSHSESSPVRAWEGWWGQSSNAALSGEGGGLPERVLIISCTLMGPSKESGLGFHDNRQAASQGDNWVSSPNPYLPQESVLSMPAFLDPERAAVWVVRAHTCWCTQRPLPSPASAKRQRDGQKQNTPGTGAKWGRRDWAEWGVALSFPDNIMNQQGVGESSEMETVNRTGQGRARLSLTVISQVTERAPQGREGRLDREQGRQ